VTMNEEPHILMVDDHQDIRELLSKHLKRYEFRTSPANGAAQARDILNKQTIDLVVLDIMMPGESGLSLCRYLREVANIPVILLTALTEETDRIIGLEMGADDYLCKPFSPRELVARINNVLRRTHSMPPQIAPLQKKVYQFDQWNFDADKRELRDKNGVCVPLSAAEYNLMLIFVERPRYVFNRDQLLELTQGRSAKSFDRSIDNQISRLRKKIERDPKNPELIQTVWGGGYSFSTDVKDILC
jgi:two-component system, OmpR family, response regulator